MYRSKAIALPRVPEHFHSCSQATIARWRYPVDRAPWATVRRSVRRIATLHLGSRDASLREECGSVPCSKNPRRRGNLWGSECDALDFGHLMEFTARRDSLHLLGQPSFPVRLQSTPRIHAASTVVFAEKIKQKLHSIQKYLIGKLLRRPLSCFPGTFRLAGKPVRLGPAQAHSRFPGTGSTGQTRTRLCRLRLRLLPQERPDSRVMTSPTGQGSMNVTAEL